MTKRRTLGSGKIKDALRQVQLAAAVAAVVVRGGWCRNARGARMYVNLGDRRGAELARKRGCLDPELARAWTELVRRERPELVVDVGANYGEIVAATDYPDARDILLIEPNPLVLPFLRRSVAGWSDPRIRLIECAAGEARNRLPLHLSPSWSGTTSLVNPREDSFTTEVDLIPLREVLPSGEGTVLIKIDVEGAELAVLKGLPRQGGRRVVALIEHEHLGKDELAELSDVWSMSAIARGTGTLIDLRGGDICGLAKQEILRDLVLTPLE